MYRSFADLCDPSIARADYTKFLEPSNPVYSILPIASGIGRVVRKSFSSRYPESIKTGRPDSGYASVPIEGERPDMAVARTKPLPTQGYGGCTSCAPSFVREDFTTCKSCGSVASEKASLLPLMDPKFNMREASKDMVLLEDHLAQEGKRCQDCILKHFLRIEGFLEEGIALDERGTSREPLNKTLQKVREAYIKHRKMLKDEDENDGKYNEIAQQIRYARKELCQRGADCMLID